MDRVFPENGAEQSPGELYMAFGPEHRVVKVTMPGGDLALAHVARAQDRLWRQHCAVQTFVDDPEGDALYHALRRLVDGCPDLVELEP